MITVFLVVLFSVAAFVTGVLFEKKNGAKVQAELDALKAATNAAKTAVK